MPGSPHGSTESSTVRSYTVDFLWPEQKLIIEIEYEAHSGRRAFTDDTGAVAETVRVLLTARRR